MSFNIFDMICESVACEETETAKRKIIIDMKNLLDTIEKELDEE